MSASNKTVSLHNKIYEVNKNIKNKKTLVKGMTNIYKTVGWIPGKTEL